MKLLALETSAKAASCAVLEDGVPVASAWQCTGLTHSRTLLPMVEDMLRSSELRIEDMDAIAVAAGPGSFTGLRIGVAAVKGLAWAAEKPCIPVSTLEGMAWPLAHLTGPVVCAMDARRQQIYNAVFLAEAGTLTRLRDFDGTLTIVGDGAALCCNYMRQQGLDCRMAPPHLRMQSAVGVGMAAARLWPEGAVAVQSLEPVYLRLSQAERERLAKSESGERIGNGKL